jgi:pimeloyl-ACP methyl ester carboxylesterase
MPDADEATTTGWLETKVPYGDHHLRVRDYPGAGPAIVLMHGFPDDLHLYDWLVPRLTPHRRIVTFDFLGWGGSDKPPGHPYTAANQVGEVAAVLDHLGPARAVLVAHDASGPPAIDWALANPDRVAALVLLNTYYAWTRGLRRPPAIALYSTPVLRGLARATVRRFPRLDERLYHWQVGRFIADDTLRPQVVGAFYERFTAARPAFWRLNDDLLPTVVSRRRSIDRLRGFPRPVRIIFGADDRYLNPRVARTFHRWFPRSDLCLLSGARHYVQIDAPERVAELLLTAPVTQ